jgi:hypothetical protein
MAEFRLHNSRLTRKDDSLAESAGNRLELDAVFVALVGLAFSEAVSRV